MHQHKKRFLLLVIFILLMGTGLAIADQDDHYKKDKDQSITKQIGGVLGWGTVIFGVIAGMLFPLRRYSKLILQRYPSIRDQFRKGLRLLANYHPLTGLLALALSIGHGILMYIHEGELGAREWIGTFAVGLIIIAAIFGYRLYQKKKNLKELRKAHITFILIAAFLAAIHILLS